MMINDITAKAGPNRKRWRVGRGTGSGNGKMSGRGHKGAGARAGYGGRVLNEGGALPLFRRLPIRGFSNSMFHVEHQAVNLADLSKYFADGDEVTVEALAKAGLINPKAGPVKVLAKGDLSKKLTVTVDAFSDAAARKIVEAGGKINDLSGQVARRAKDRARAEAVAAKAAAKAETEAKPKGKAKGEAKGEGEGKAKKSEGQPKSEKKEPKKEAKKENPGE